MSRWLFITKSQQNRGSYWRGWYLGSQLSRMGHDFTLICPAEYRQMGIRHESFGSNFNVITLPRLTLRTVPPGIVLRTALSPFICRLGEKDIVHVCAPSFPETFVAAWSAHLRRVPVVVDIDDWWGFDPDGGRSAFESRLEQLLEWRSIKYADGAIVASEILQDKIQSSCGIRPDIVPNGIDVGDFSSLERSGCRNALHERLGVAGGTLVVTAAFDSNFQQIIDDAAGQLYSEGVDIRFLVVGLPPSHNSPGNVMRTGKLERREWLQVLSGSDLLLMLMKETLWEKARFPIKLAEFMASGRPIVSSSVGESRRVMLNAGYDSDGSGLLIQNSAEALCGGIRHYMKEQAACEEIAEVAKRYATEKLSWSAIASDYLKLVKKLL